MKKIVRIFRDETKYLRETLQLALQIIKESYPLVRERKLVSSQFQEKMEKLVRLNYGQRDIKFSSDESGSDFEEKEDCFSKCLNSPDVSIRNGIKRGNSDDEKHGEHQMNRKLFKADNNIDGSENDLPSIKIEPLYEAENLNETHVVAPGSREMGVDVNSTFQVPSSSLARNKEIYKGILMDQNVNVTNKGVLSKGKH